MSTQRLRELAIYAGYLPHYSTKADRMEKFDEDVYAELILQEVLKVIEAAEPAVAGLPIDVALHLVRKNVIDYFGLE